VSTSADPAGQAINAVFKQEMNDLIEANPNVIVVVTTVGAGPSKSCCGDRSSSSLRVSNWWMAVPGSSQLGPVAGRGAPGGRCTTLSGIRAHRECESIVG
jgi:hypothetical protein